MKFIETCPLHSKAPYAFNLIDGAVYQYPADDSDRFTKYREWLKGALYLNEVDPLYFCACAQSIAGTFSPTSVNKNLAVIQYLIEHTNCNQEELRLGYTMSRKSQYDTWRSGDTTVPLDTTLPSLHELGLDLLMQHGWVGNEVYNARQVILNISVSINPFNEETALRFELSEDAYVKIEMFDLLGNAIDITMRSAVFTKGKQEVRIAGSTLPAGSYFLRLSSSSGDVQTLKLTHE